jgi:hypothetical protein
MREAEPAILCESDRVLLESCCGKPLWLLDRPRITLVRIASVHRDNIGILLPRRMRAPAQLGFSSV